MDTDDDFPDCDLPECPDLDCTPDDGTLDLLLCAADDSDDDAPGSRQALSRRRRRRRPVLTIIGGCLLVTAVGAAIIYSLRDSVSPEEQRDQVYQAAPLDFTLDSKRARVERYSNSHDSFLFLYDPPIGDKDERATARQVNFDVACGQPSDFYLDVLPRGPSAEDHLGTILSCGDKHERRTDYRYGDLDSRQQETARRDFSKLIAAAYNSL